MKEQKAGERQTDRQREQIDSRALLKGVCAAQLTVERHHRRRLATIVGTDISNMQCIVD